RERRSTPHSPGMRGGVPVNDLTVLAAGAGADPAWIASPGSWRADRGMFWRGSRPARVHLPGGDPLAFMHGPFVLLLAPLGREPGDNGPCTTRAVRARPMATAATIPG